MKAAADNNNHRWTRGGGQQSKIATKLAKYAAYSI